MVKLELWDRGSEAQGNKKGEAVSSQVLLPGKPTPSGYRSPRTEGVSSGRGAPAGVRFVFVWIGACCGRDPSLNLIFTRIGRVSLLFLSHYCKWERTGVSLDIFGMFSDLSLHI